jgi:hypothetical protein
MSGKAAEFQPRREFLKLAAFTGVAALAGKAAPAGAEQSATPPAADTSDGGNKMDILRVSGSYIVDAKGNRVRLRGTCPGGWMNMEDFINGRRSKQKCALAGPSTSATIQAQNILSVRVSLGALPQPMITQSPCLASMTRWPG